MMSFEEKQAGNWVYQFPEYDNLSPKIRATCKSIIQWPRKIYQRFNAQKDTYCLAAMGALWSTFAKDLNHCNMIQEHHANFPSNSTNVITRTKTA